MKTLPETPTPAMLDAAVTFALNVQVTGHNGWSHYMRDLYETMAKAAPDKSDEWREALEAVMREMPDRGYRGNAPGHAHQIPGVWDSDNVPALAGNPCAWCLAYKTARTLLAASEQPK